MTADPLESDNQILSKIRNLYVTHPDNGQNITLKEGERTEPELDMLLQEDRTAALRHLLLERLPAALLPTVQLLIGSS
ncbi:uncharacterized protein G6M90_00g114040 [Metarhizium brunneum]|uniref:Uncharacterized protein n=1 Tax=Metarhizium brunneum TaxID=500148 RepID=A0A7D5ZAS7_9HYPO|nr:hypothetical protein G6M90_00g114040 [Metarhizium brunneum]